tara:strand:+ start:678 stop:935 length:258 start_codon:yes stop_codon:yes gene_type:complete
MEDIMNDSGYFKGKLEQINDEELKKEIEDFVLVCNEYPRKVYDIENRIIYLVFKAYLAGKGEMLDKFSPEVDKISEKINDIKAML